jgi:hypothetical protein
MLLERLKSHELGLVVHTCHPSTQETEAGVSTVWGQFETPSQKLKVIIPELDNFFCSTGVWSLGFTLVKRALYHLRHSVSPFCSDYFCDTVSLFAQASLDQSPVFYASWVAGMTGMHQLPLRWGLASFLPELAINHNTSELCLPSC